MTDITLEKLNPLINIYDKEVARSMTKNEKDIYFHLLIYSHLFKSEFTETPEDNLISRAKILCDTLKTINENKEQTNLKTEVLSEIKKVSIEKKPKKSNIIAGGESSNVIKSIVDNYYNQNNINDSITNQIIRAVLDNKKNKASEKMDEKQSEPSIKEEAKPVVIKKLKKFVIKNDNVN